MLGDYDAWTTYMGCMDDIHGMVGMLISELRFPATCFEKNGLRFFVPWQEFVRVNGSQAAPGYKFLKATSKSGRLFGSRIKWNFAKFLVDKEGHVINRYSPTTGPLSIEQDNKKALGFV
ncbi:hypothetical protein NE237_015761 [Protea cynaroides]|uniref:Glutathione peroxidase n=1 Tax=Protea cynaroides TaxID=273540 RepID=A0A9Q0QRD3_9MAGN|nr:hypothetical protein NE237_015761 [Protea cynaroides]